MLSLLGPLASLLGIEVGTLIERYRRDAFVWVAIASFIGIGGLFLLIAANSALTLSFGPVVAPLMMAGGALVIALLVYLAARIHAAYGARAEAERRHSAETTALVTTAAMTAVPLLAKSGLLRKVGLPLGGALAAAYFLSRSSSANRDD